MDDGGADGADWKVNVRETRVLGVDLLTVRERNVLAETNDFVALVCGDAVEEAVSRCRGPCHYAAKIKQASYRERRPCACVRYMADPRVALA